MLEMNTGNVNINVSNIIGNSKKDDKIVATFSANFSIGMMKNFSTSKNVVDMALYESDHATVDADYAAFEENTRELVAAVTAAVGGVIAEEKLADEIY